MKLSFRFSFSLIALIGLFSCNFQRFDPIVTMQSSNNRMELLSIILKQEHNPDLHSDIPPVFNGNEITFFIPTDLDSTSDPFILDFEINGYNSVFLDSTVLESGITSHVFGHDRENLMIIQAANGDCKEYTIRLIEEFHSFLLFQDPNAPAVTGIPQYNSSFPVYILFNSPVDPASLTASDFVSDAGISILSDPDMVRDNTLYKAEVDSGSLPSGEYTLTLPAGSVANQSSGPNPPLNDSDSSLKFIWDIDPPSFDQPGIDPLSRNSFYPEAVSLKCNSYVDNHSAPEELRYSLFYVSNTSATPASLDISNVFSDGTPVLPPGSTPGTIDWFNITSSDLLKEVTPLPSDCYYKFVLVIEDKVGNRTISNNLDAYLSSTIHVSASRGDDANADGTKALPFASIQPALDFAWEHGQQTVKVSEGTYYPGADRLESLRMYPDMILQGGFNSNFSLRDFALYTSIISGDIDHDDALYDNDDSEHLFFHDASLIDPPNLNSIIDGFTFTHGRSRDVNNGGGAIFSACDLSIVKCNFIENNSEGIGGGAIHIVDGAILNISECIFQRNNSVSSLVGEIYYGGAIYVQNSTLDISSSLFGGISGQNESNIGGAIAIEDDPSKPSRSYLISIDNDFSMNSAIYTKDNTLAKGGAIYLRGSNGTYSSSNDKFSGNFTSSKGGAIYVQSNKMAIDNGYFSNNYCFDSTGKGGAVSVYNGSIKLEDSTFLSNWTNGSGGAVHLETIQSSAQIKNSIFKENGGNSGSSNISGGAISLIGESPLTLSIENSVFIKNKSSTGPAIFMKGESTFIVDTRITQSIFQENENNGINHGGTIFIESGNLEASLNLFFNNKDNSSADKVMDIFMNSGETMSLYANEFMTDAVMTNSYFIHSSANTGDIYFGANHYCSSQNYASPWKYFVNPNQVVFETSNLNTPLNTYFDIYFTTLATTNIENYFTDNSPFYPKYTPSLAPNLGQLIDKVYSITGYSFPSEDITGSPRLIGSAYDRGPYEHLH